MTTVSANMIDSDGTPWRRGTWTVTFVPNPNEPNIARYNVGGTPLGPSDITQSGVIDNTSSAHFSFNVIDNSTIVPAGSQWKLTVCPLASSKCGFYVFSAVGSSIDVSSALTLLMPVPRFIAIPGSFGYAETEAILSQNPGSTYWDVNLEAQKFWNDSINAWVIGSGGSGGSQGPQGPAGTIAIAATLTGAPGSNANVVNSGTPSAAILTFTIPSGVAGPQGTQGNPGGQGPAGTVTVGTTTTGFPGSGASVVNVGTSTAAVLNFTIPQGATGLQGIQGPPSTVPGPQGNPGTAASITIDTTTTGAAGTPASVANVGSSSNAVLQFTIPAGAQGPPGNNGTGAPAGASGAIQYNNAGVFAGAPIVVTNVANLTSSANLNLTNATLATSGANQSSPTLNLQGTYWNGSASATDTWTVQNAPLAGTTNIAQLKITHAGAANYGALILPSPNMCMGINTAQFPMTAVSGVTFLVNGIPGSSSAKTVAIYRFGAEGSGGGALAHYHANGSETAPTAPTVGDMFHTKSVFCGTTTGAFAANPSFCIRHVVTGGSASVGLIDTHFMNNNTVNGTPTSCLTITDQNPFVGIDNASPAAGLDIGPGNAGSFGITVNVATATTNFSSSAIRFSGSVWNGSAGVVDYWQWQNAIPAGTNSASTLTLTHSGTTGAALIKIPQLPVYANNAAAITGGLTAGTLYRTGADPDPVCIVH